LVATVAYLDTEVAALGLTISFQKGQLKKMKTREPATSEA